jgi:hypothetical protein
VSGTGSPGVRLHTTSAAVGTDGLVAGRDLVLHLHPLHGTDAPAGTYVLDHLAPAERHAADRVALRAQATWRDRLGEPLTIDGLCWPFVWELPLYERLNPAVARALGLRRGLQDLAATRIRLGDTDSGTARLAHAVGAYLGIPVDRDGGGREAGGFEPPPSPPVPRGRRVRQAALGAVTVLGAPTLMRTGAVAVDPYWPLMPMLDRMLQEPARRPAVFLGRRPNGVARSLRAAVRGGWIGLPTPADRRRARRLAAGMIAAARDGGALEADGLELGPWLYPRLAALVERRAAHDLAEAAMLRRAFRSRRPRWIVGAYDMEPHSRLVVLLAQEAGIGTLMLCHGAYVLPQPIVDLEVCDQVALWTRAVAPPMRDGGRPIHLVGYPIPHGRPPMTRRWDSSANPAIAVLGQVPVRETCLLDERVTMRCYETALHAVARRWPRATVVLRPHPSQNRAAYPVLVRRFPTLEILQDATTDIADVLRGVDLCIGSASTATLQAALVGTPVVVLNLSGEEWGFPIGGETSVPIARSSEGLDAILEAWALEGTLGGREDLLSALGADGSDAVARLLSVLDRPQATDRRRR